MTWSLQDKTFSKILTPTTETNWLENLLSAILHWNKNNIPSTFIIFVKYEVNNHKFFVYVPPSNETGWLQIFKAFMYRGTTLTYKISSEFVVIWNLICREISQILFPLKVFYP